MPLRQQPTLFWGEGGHRGLRPKAKAFYGPSYGIIQIIQNIQDIQGFQDFHFCSKNIYFLKKIPCLFADFANSSSISPRIAMS
jgi:hypothetical protein